MPLRIVLAPNAFKGCLSALEAARAMQAGVWAACPDAETALVPVADGGDGFADVIVAALSGESHTQPITGPAWETRKARYGYIPEHHTAVIEMATASGLALIPPDKQNPMKTTTLGTGELILDALNRGAKRIVVGVGGSATCDCGMGVAHALGIRFYDEANMELRPCGENMNAVRRIDLAKADARIAQTEIDVICDVDNPLYGLNGASYVYAPQKGASPEQVEELDNGLRALARIIEHDCGVRVDDVSGSGAAGGLAAGLMAFLGAKLKPGVEMVLELVEFNKHVTGADLVITGEGKLDEQTASGKAPAGVAAQARTLGVPCIAIAGSVADDLSALHAAGIAAALSLCDKPMTLDEAMENAASLLTQATEQAMRVFVAGWNAHT